MRKRSQRPSVQNMSYGAARSIMSSYNEQNEAYLRSMVRNHVPDAEKVLSCADRKNLLFHTRTIKGVAKKVNDSDKRILVENQDILARIRLLPSLVDINERELLDERICLQLEGRNIPFGCNLSNAYTGVKNLLR